MHLFLDDSFPILLKFKLPDPMVVTLGQPLKLTAGAVIKETTPMFFKVKHKMQRKFLGIWWTLPCVGSVGSW